MSTDLAILRARLESAVAVDAPAKPKRLSVSRLAKMYRAHAAKRFNGRHGYKEVNTIRQATGALSILYGRLKPEEIESLHVRAVRQYWVQADLAATTIANRMQRLRKCWLWARRCKLIACDLPDVEPLPFGHARKPEPIRPVMMAVVEATLPFLSPTVAVMVQLMAHTGMRPGECADLHSSEIDRSKSEWRYRPSLQKTSWRGIETDIYIGPIGQQLLMPMLQPGYIFRTKSGGRWNEKLLHSAVRKACIKGNIPHWHPNQLRHAWGTMLREKMGLEHSQASLRHKTVEQTQVYAERSERLAREAAARFG